MTYSGIDLAHILRFHSWLSKSNDELRRIFSANEITEFTTRIQHAHDETRTQTGASLLASRFAVKEAAYKAFSQLLVARSMTEQSFSFTAFAPYVSTTRSETWNVPQLSIDYDGFAKATSIRLPLVSSSLSLSHDGEYAIAIVSLTSLPSPQK